MQLPGLANAVIEPRKLRDYLLSHSHPVGRAKASFFEGLGYTRENGILAEQVEAVESGRTRFGTKYEVRGTVTGPAGREADVVSIWIILADEEEDFPRFVTAYPGSRE